jgi:hypothetical protein
MSEKICALVTLNVFLLALTLPVKPTVRTILPRRQQAKAPFNVKTSVLLTLVIPRTRQAAAMQLIPAMIRISIS